MLASESRAVPMVDVVGRSMFGGVKCGVYRSLGSVYFQQVLGVFPIKREESRLQVFDRQVLKRPYTS